MLVFTLTFDQTQIASLHVAWDQGLGVKGPQLCLSRLVPLPSLLAVVNRR